MPNYEKTKGWFDGLRGFTDGLSGVVGSVGQTVDHVSDIHEDIAGGMRLQNDVDQNRRERELAMRETEQDIVLTDLKVRRGDNLKLYATVGAAALIGVVLITK